jgi:farnesyl diphosphate synthase
MLKLLPKEPNSVAEAMTYSALGKGKRLRPYLVLASASLVGVPEEEALNTAASIEFIHTYSLIHDDLPAMDNDELRRGEATCHIKFGEANAILAGDALLTIAFEILAEIDTHPDSSIRCQLISRIAKAIGVSGMVGGQALDISNIHLNPDKLLELYKMKTGELFAASCEAGAMLGNASTNLRQVLKDYAYALGLAFQIRDDFEDLGDGQLNYVTICAQLQKFISLAIASLAIFDHKADALRELAYFIANKT